MLDVLRRIIQEVNTAQDLDQVLFIIVSKVKQSMSVDAASIYMADVDNNEFVLSETEGLNHEAAGVLRLPIDEGLTGYVIRTGETLNLADAKSDKRYRDVAGSGEERFSAYLGVPIVHQRKVLGALVVQRKERRQFREESVAFLIALASQLAGSIAHETIASETSTVSGSDQLREKYFNCIPGAPGVAIGTAIVVYGSTDFDSVPNRKITDVDQEVGFFRQAVADVCKDIELMKERMADVLSEEESALFDAYMMLANSNTLVNDTIRRISTGNWAQGALRDTIREHSIRFNNMSDEYMRERADDLKEIGMRIFKRLHTGEAAPIRYPKRTILVGEEIGATQLAEIPAKRIAGVISARGSNSSHLAILARAMGIPAVMGASNVSLGWMDQCEVIADGYQGRIYVEPPPIVRAEYSRLMREESQLKKELKGLKRLAAETTDKVQVKLMVNSGLLADEKAVDKKVGDGVGLYRTEFPFMVRSSFPGEAEQADMYRSVLKAYAPNPVTLRTLDVGGDKPLNYFPMSEENPYLGWRGIRVTLDHPDIFITQVKAMLKASAGLSNLNILFPMISNLDELEEAQTLYEQALYEVKQEGVNIEPPRIGVMIEVPSAVMQAESLAKRVDFLSIGTNDLTQYLLAVDRNNARVRKLYDSLHPAVLKAIMQVVEAGRKHVKPICVCGELSADPAGAVLMLGMGINSLSMAPTSLQRIKWVIRSFSYRDARELLNQAMEKEHAWEIRRLVNEGLEKAGVGTLIHTGR